ncbi:hypothetical protein HID58_065967 [Brassica napus]|uniref:F-box associated beta-propeller type 3 domain-containing protein n=1 Tax=Brassica napus TaxID=3708 RepID=A0ABQ7ZEQ6_BRANA|nr:hypothetical protein HID58_065967 [Brassica napus]
MKFPPDDKWIFRRDNGQFACGYASGLIYFYGMWTDKNEVPVICNPNTGRYETLPYISRVMTLGTRGMRWRKIHCSLRLDNLSEGVCINGVLYYLGDTSECKEKIREKSSFAIACFDIRSEKFKILYPESFCELTNYNGVHKLFPHYASVVGVISTGFGEYLEASKCRVYVFACKRL